MLALSVFIVSVLLVWRFTVFALKGRAFFSSSGVHVVGVFAGLLVGMLTGALAGAMTMKNQQQSLSSSPQRVVSVESNAISSSASPQPSEQQTASVPSVRVVSDNKKEIEWHRQNRDAARTYLQKVKSEIEALQERWGQGIDPSEYHFISKHMIALQDEGEVFGLPFLSPLSECRGVGIAAEAHWSALIWGRAGRDGTWQQLNETFTKCERKIDNPPEFHLVIHTTENAPPTGFKRCLSVPAFEHKSGEPFIWTCKPGE